MISPTEPEYLLFRDLAKQELGLDWTRDKKYLLETRLGPRLEHLGISSFTAYHQHLQQLGSVDEKQYFHNAITTTKTGFYRDKEDFAFFRKKVLPQVYADDFAESSPAIRFWSAGCSSGEEPFSLLFEALEELEQRRRYQKPFDLRILGSDVNTDMLSIGENALYLDHQMEGLPEFIREKYFRHAAGTGRTAYQVVSEVRSQVQYRHFNLLDRRYPIATRFQVIFFRNVLYYLNRPLRQPLLNRLSDYLLPKGWLFLGNVETGYSIPGMQKIHSNIFCKTP
jgi:chemotaxis protein methyltransferase CheR